MLVFGFKERPGPFVSKPRPRRGRHVLAPHDPERPSDPANPGLAVSGRLMLGGIDEETAVVEFDVDCDADISLDYD